MSLLDTKFIDSDARMSRIVGDPYQAGFKIIRTWPEGHANYADTKITAMNAIKRVTNPTADKQTYSGIFIASETQPTEGEDRRPTLRQVLTKIKPVTDTASLGPSVDEARAQKMNPFGVRGGDANYRIRSWMYLDPDDEQETIGLTPSGDTNYTLIDKNFNHESDRTGTLSCLYKKMAWNNDTGVFTKVRVINEGGWGEQVTRSATGMPIDDAISLVENIASSDSLLTYGYSERAEGEGVASKTEWSGDSIAVETEYQRGYERVGPRRTQTWYAIPPTRRNTVYDIAKEYVGEAGDTLVHKGVAMRVRPDGYATIRATAWQPTNQDEGGGNYWPTDPDSVGLRWTNYNSRYTSKKKERQDITYVAWRKYYAARQNAETWIAEDTWGDPTNPPSPTRNKNKKIIKSDIGRLDEYKYEALKIRMDTWTAWRFTTDRDPAP